MNRLQPIVPIYQREFGHCGIACLSMALNIKYDEILRLVPSHIDLSIHGLSDNDVYDIIKKCNFKSAIISRDFDEHLHTWRRGICAVPSLTGGFWHYIVYDSEQGLFDPSCDRPNYVEDMPRIKGETYWFPSSAVLIGEV